MPADATDIQALLRPTAAIDWRGAAHARYAAGVRLLDLNAPPPAGSLCLIGMPDDLGVRLNGGRAGAAEGPRAFREALLRYGVGSPMHLHGPIPALYDAGDVVPTGSLEETHSRVTRVVERVLALGCLPIGIGGGHDLTFAFARGHAASTQEQVRQAVYLDPHLDVRAEDGSGMPFRALVERAGFTRLVCIGPEPLANTREHFEWFRGHGGVVEDVGSALAKGGTLFDRPSHFSLDLDAIDASSAPGVSAMNPAGVSVREAAAVCGAAGRAAMVRSFDVMELSPPLDQQGRTARVAVYCFLSFVAGFAERTFAGTLGKGGAGC
ncbi:MAG: formimidoylglutamase [Phycisphaerales bacterium]